VRRQRRGPHFQRRGTCRNARVRAGGPRAARKEVHEDHLARPGSALMNKSKLKKNDLVIVISGRDRGRQGKILRILPAHGGAIGERVNLIKGPVRPTPAKNSAGGISEKEAPIHLSNLMLVDPDRNTRTRIGRRRDKEGAPERYAKKSGAALA